MKKISTVATKQNRNFSEQKLTIGLDSDRPSHGRRQHKLALSRFCNSLQVNVDAL
jgi:hypothetical protein